MPDLLFFSGQQYQQYSNSGWQNLMFLQCLQLPLLLQLLVLILYCIGQWENLNSSEKLQVKSIFISALLGLINPFIYYIILLKAYKLLPAQVAQPLKYDMAYNTGISFSAGAKTKNSGKKLCCSVHQFCRCLYYIITGTSLSTRKIGYNRSITGNRKFCFLGSLFYLQYER